MASFEAMGRQGGGVVNALLAGTRHRLAAAAAPVPPTLHVDWRQVRRWGIDESAIPRDAVVHFREPTLLEEYRNEVDRSPSRSCCSRPR